MWTTASYTIKAFSVNKLGKCGQYLILLDNIDYIEDIVDHCEIHLKSNKILQVDDTVKGIMKFLNESGE